MATRQGWVGWGSLRGRDGQVTAKPAGRWDLRNLGTSWLRKARCCAAQQTKVLTRVVWVWRLRVWWGWIVCRHSETQQLSDIRVSFLQTARRPALSIQEHIAVPG